MIWWLLAAGAVLQFVALLVVIGRMAHLSRKLKLIAEVLDLAPCYRMAVLQHVVRGAGVPVVAPERQPRTRAGEGWN